MYLIYSCKPHPVSAANPSGGTVALTPRFPGLAFTFVSPVGRDGWRANEASHLTGEPIRQDGDTNAASLCFLDELPESSLSSLSREQRLSPCLVLFHTHDSGAGNKFVESLVCSFVCLSILETGKQRCREMNKISQAELAT